MKQFEYKTIDIKPSTKGFFGTKGIELEQIDKTLNEMGQEGWELISVQEVSTFDGTMNYILYTFKREIE